MDKIGKNTGPGKVREEVVRNGEVLVIADLFNYNFDGNILKEEHKEWLETRLVPLLRSFSVHVKLRGTASRKGNADYNKQLSLERVLRVKKFLTDRGIKEDQAPGQEMQAAGEDVSPAEHVEDDERDRAVRVTVALGTKPKPIFPTIVLPPMIITPNDPVINLPPQIIIITRPRKKIPINVSQDWGIKQLAAAEAEVLIGTTAMAFQVVDFSNSEEVICVLPAVSSGVGLPASVSLEGPMNRFRSPKPQRITDYSGITTWRSLFDVGPFSKDAITFSKVPGSTPGEPLTVPMDTGLTIGASGPSIAQGFMVCSDPRPFRP